jgi:hypothetical protein
MVDRQAVVSTTIAEALPFLATCRYEKEVTQMEYSKPEVVAVVEATFAIEGTKPGVVAESSHPTVPPRSTGAYVSDE